MHNRPAAANQSTKPYPVEKLSILIPVYNEIRTIERLLDRVMTAPLPCPREVVIVDDGSTDGTRDILRRFAKANTDTVRLIFHRRNGGKGKAIRTAIRHMTGDWAIIQDADLEYDPYEFRLLLGPVEDGVADAVFGSRFLSGRYRRAMLFWHTMANRILTLTSNVLNDLNLTDMETCYKLVRADILRCLNIRSAGFDLEPELTAKLARWGARIYEVPISYRGRSYAEGKKIGAKDAIHAFLAMVRYRYFDELYAKHEGFLILQALRRARRFNDWMMEQVRPWIGQLILEAGSGIGNLTERLLDRRRLVCVDYEDFYVDRLEQAYGHLGNFSIARADLLEAGDIAAASAGEAFDTILCCNVLEHIGDDARVLRNFHDALQPGGHALILVPHDPSLFSPADEALGHFRRYTRKGLAQKMQDAGFEVVKTFGFNRVGGLGWRLNKMMRRRTISPGQMVWFEMLMPIIKLLERIPLHSHNSVIAVGRKPGKPT